jgi:hypothetical protein
VDRPLEADRPRFRVLLSAAAALVGAVRLGSWLERAQPWQWRGVWAQRPVLVLVWAQRPVLVLVWAQGWRWAGAKRQGSERASLVQRARAVRWQQRGIVAPLPAASAPPTPLAARLCHPPCTL